MEKFMVRRSYGDRLVVYALMYKTPQGYFCRVYDGIGYFETFPKSTKSAAKKALFATKVFEEVKK